MYKKKKKGEKTIKSLYFCEYKGTLFAIDNYSYEIYYSYPFLFKQYLARHQTFMNFSNLVPLEAQILACPSKLNVIERSWSNDEYLFGRNCSKSAK